jgi:hypothetical protein
MTAKTTSTASYPSYEPCLEEIEGWAHELDGWYLASHCHIASLAKNRHVGSLYR